MKYHVGDTMTASMQNRLIAYGTLVILLAVIIGTHLLWLCVFLLFLYLFTDVFISTVRKIIPQISARFALWIFYILLVSFMTFLGIRVVPLFFSDFPEYYALVIRDGAIFLNSLSERYGQTIDFTALSNILFAHKNASISVVVMIINKVSKGFIYFLFAVILNFLIISERDRIMQVFAERKDSILAYVSNFLTSRIIHFYRYFKSVMGGQVVISLINTAITFVIIMILGLPHKISLVTIVFLCGLLPVVGNLISNTILAITALVSTGFVALVICLSLLIVIHKLEYFLNSRIIGSIVRLPMALTLIALLTGEALLGIYGMIIAVPVFLIVRDELASLRIKKDI